MLDEQQVKTLTDLISVTAFSPRIQVNANSYFPADIEDDMHWDVKQLELEKLFIHGSADDLLRQVKNLPEKTWKDLIHHIEKRHSVNWIERMALVAVYNIPVICSRWGYGSEMASKYMARNIAVYRGDVNKIPSQLIIALGDLLKIEKEQKIKESFTA